MVGNGCARAGIVTSEIAPAAISAAISLRMAIPPLGRLPATAAGTLGMVAHTKRRAGKN